MYLFVKILIIVICLIGILYMVRINTKYKNNNKTGKEDIINYFAKKNATSIENGIKTKDLPIFIAKSPYRLLMVKDGTLAFKKGKYYLNSKK